MTSRARLCPGCRSLDGEHDFGPTCTLADERMGELECDCGRRTPAPLEASSGMIVRCRGCGKIWNGYGDLAHGYWEPGKSPDSESWSPYVRLRDACLELLRETTAGGGKSVCPVAVLRRLREICRVVLENDERLCAERMTDDEESDNDGNEDGCAV